MRAKCIEPVIPERAVRLEPGIEFGQRCRIEVVEPALGVAANAHEPVLAEHPQVLRHTRLAQPGPLDDLPDGTCAVTQKIEDFPPARFRYSSKRICHTRYITTRATVRKG